MSIVYISAQFFGAILGFALLKILMPADYWVEGFCMTLPHKLISPMQALVIEIIITTTLIIVVCAVWDKRNEANQDSTALRFGLIVAAISMVAGPLTGASMNTVRTFAPALWLNDFRHQWVYWLGPNMGAVLGCGIYKYLFSLPEEDPLTKEEEEVVDLQDIKLEKA
ncbi:unnamed protein product [Psylliodes chrysocephalus]|uniref:Uncharacterized protein n=1 Tax=Psylliodes chrysocephalus TaxID=3402493 RepID=A0A9P0GFD9_9CUCU|nr:unnamed protein product [Psylliodes chrysocephala]